ncbi:pseudouridine synthase [Arsenicicoccus dermatophilus]|uniref:pseudouridine synthase n=1 Tax=Arsenicicoccus dermatophilus TaxID=1076331 RepID=UPI0039170653
MSPQQNSRGGSGRGQGGARRGSGYTGAGGGRAGGPTGGPQRKPGARRVAGQRPVRGQGAQAPGGAGGRGRGPAQPYVDVHDPDGTRLQKLLASAGIGSRRTCENLIAEGHVQVDGQVVTDMGVRVDPATAQVHVDGVRVIFDETKVYYAFNKPLNVVTSMNDELGRVDIGDYLGEGRKTRLFHVGRLDQDTEGLLLLTNDGELAHRLQHPAYGVTKTYLAQVPGPVPRDLGRQLREGVELEDGPVRVDSFKVIDSSPGKAVLEIVIHEGRKHVVRRMLEAVGHPVINLVRVKVGEVGLGHLKAGKMRPLTRQEISSLYEAAQL